MADLDTASAYDLSMCLRDRKLGAAELMAHCLDRIEKSNDGVNALVTLDKDQAMDMAKEADNTSPDGRLLHGLPLAVKDCYDIGGMRGTSGSRAFADRVAEADTLHVARLRKAGALPFAKTNTPEFTMGGQTVNEVFGITRNPYDLTKTTTGSSGGSAAALAAKMTMLADGSDIGGSVRSPAGACNVVGFRPSHGVIPASPAFDPYSVINTPGPMARTVTDIALMLLVMSGPDDSAPIASRRVDALSDVIEPPDIRGMRIAWAHNPAGAVSDAATTDVLDAQRPTFEKLGCSIADHCPDLVEAHQAQQTLYSIAQASEVRDIVRASPHLIGEHVCKRVDAILGMTSADDIVTGIQQRKRGWALLAETFDRFDVMVWPVNPVRLFSADLAESDYVFDWRPVEISPVFGLPSISVPGGFSDDGLPVGLQILGRPGADETVLRVARAFEAETEFWKTAPFALS
ncbi:MAG: amidase family protein [Alphaproteobacteria bacterium]